MVAQIIVVEDVKQWHFSAVGCPVVDVDDYLTAQEYFSLKNAQIINLCKDYRYSSIGYYCSLLAEARRHRVIPSVKSILNLSSKAMYSVDAVTLDEEVQKAFRQYPANDQADELELTVMFGRCQQEGFALLARRIFEVFPCPLLSVTFKRLDHWRVTAIRPRTLRHLKSGEEDFFARTVSAYLIKRWRAPRQKTHGRYDLAILHDPNDPLPPSNMKALKAFVSAGQKLGVDVELIRKKDYARLAEYDALFIRDTTRINHYTYRFAKKAESEGMVVMDDPNSILRCANKVYLAEMLRANRIPAPRSVILGRNDLDAAEQAIGYPLVLKVPDGAFSLGVFKVENRAEFDAMTKQLFKKSELILVQEYLYTEYDWRIGILNRQPIYACQYFMFKKHWQVVKHDGRSGAFKEGDARTWPVAEAPAAVVEIAVKAAGLIGDGLYGVDVKQLGSQVFVIEVNDNPNLDVGVEDLCLGEELFMLVMRDFVRRLESRK